MHRRQLLSLSVPRHVIRVYFALHFNKIHSLRHDSGLGFSRPNMRICSQRRSQTDLISSHSQTDFILFTVRHHQVTAKTVYFHTDPNLRSSRKNFQVGCHIVHFPRHVMTRRGVQPRSVASRFILANLKVERRTRIMSN